MVTDSRVFVSVPTNIHVFKGLPHGFHSVGNKLKATDHWATVMYGGIKWALEQPQASGKFDVTVW